ncbi:Rossmann-like fold-containing protein [Oceanospirillum maris]|uniref:Rossmann-like fold-containing protein n=1 Tax=Oceanospirillum maris TaxID=64977 RepID=UPI000424E5E7|nr:Rossmann-like fold-containing protein [Oceanospirillum maris]
MYLDPTWRVLTIGDGDLSFSLSLADSFLLESPLLLEPNAKGLAAKKGSVTASVLDSEALLLAKYQDCAFNELKQKGVAAYTGLDITDASTWADTLKGQFDALIFQFPLIPSFTSKADFERAGGLSTNLLNRRLLRLYLKHGFDFFLDPDGAQLALISSKDLKPYSQWDLECGIHLDLMTQQKQAVQLLGQCPFDQQRFTGYRIRNVDRDKQIRGTKGTTYYWSVKPAPEALMAQLTAPTHSVGEPVSDRYCNWCHTGPFASKEDRQGHLESRRHQNMQSLDDDWRAFLQV